MNLPALHLVTGDRVAARSDFPALAERLFEAHGPDLAFHLRLKRATGRQILEVASGLSGAAEKAGGWCVINERLDVALATGAHAVQLGHTALPVSVAVQVIRAATAAERGTGGATGPRRTRALAIGASVHGEPEARQGVTDGANFLLLGTIFSSRSHPGVRPHGPAIVERCRDLGVPMIAIGGIDRGRVAALKRAGASGVAVVSAVWDARDPVEASGALIRAWKAS